MRSRPARRRATYSDLLAVPSHLVAESVDGELIASPRPAISHAHVASVLGMDIGSPFQRGRGGPGGWWVLFEPELHLGDDVLVPDLAAWRREHVSTLPDGPYITIAPDWVCEVLSPSTAVLDRVRKLHIYAGAGVAHAWLVDPGQRTLEIYRRASEQWLRVAAYADAERVRAEPFEAVELDLAALWMPEAPTTP